MSGRNKLHQNICNKTRIKKQIVTYFETDEAAYLFEKKLIKPYKQFGYCEANLSTGGKGSLSGCTAWNRGIPFSKESRIKMSESAKNRKPPTKETLEKKRRSMLGKNKGKKPWTYGKKLPEETKRKIGLASIGRGASTLEFEILEADKIIWEGSSRRECSGRTGISRSALDQSINTIKRRKIKYVITRTTNYKIKLKQGENSG